MNQLKLDYQVYSEYFHQPGTDRVIASAALLERPVNLYGHFSSNLKTYYGPSWKNASPCSADMAQKHFTDVAYSLGMHASSCPPERLLEVVERYNREASPGLAKDSRLSFTMLALDGAELSGVNFGRGSDVFLLNRYGVERISHPVDHDRVSFSVDSVQRFTRTDWDVALVWTHSSPGFGLPILVEHLLAPLALSPYNAVKEILASAMHDVVQQRVTVIRKVLERDW